MMSNGAEHRAVVNRFGLAIRLSKRSRGLLNAYRTLAPDRAKWFGKRSFDHDNAEPILLGLSMELALKAWWVFDFDKRNPPRTHDLEKLFAALCEDSKVQLREAYARDVLPRNPHAWSPTFRLDDFIAYNKDAFVNWRYSHEKENVNMVVSEFEDTLDMMLSEFEKRYVELETRPQKIISDG